MCPECDAGKDSRGEVEILRLQGQINAEPILAALRANGIACRVRGEALGSVYGLTLDGLGEVAILVAPEHAEQARELLAAGEQHALEPTDGEAGDER
jgi:hypothetical protein